MFVTKRALPRRTFLRGVGTTMALPLLESMVPAFTALAQTPAKPPMRFGAVYFPNGATMKHWMPDADRCRASSTRPILKPLEPFRDRVNLYGNLSRAGGKSVTDHAVSSAGWLSGAVAKQTEAEDIQVGISIDQVIAKQIGQDTQLPSMEVATEDFSGYVGGCVPGYACAYMNTISWASETTVEPDGDQSAHRVRADVRPRRDDGRASMRGCKRIAAFSIRSPRKRATCSARSGRAIARGSATTSITCARSSAASSGRKRRTRSTC